MLSANSVSLWFTQRDDSVYQALRPLIFRLSPERAHTVTLALLRMCGATAPGRGFVRALFAPRLAGPPVHAFGLTFTNPVGLAAGYDKDGLGWRGLAALGLDRKSVV